MTRIRYTPACYGGNLYRGKDEIGLIQKVNNEPNYRFHSEKRGFTWEEMDDICSILWEIEHKKQDKERS